MRRFAVLLSVVVMMLVGTVSPGTPTPVIAQEATPDVTATAIPPLLAAWAAAWTAGDPEQVIAFYTEDAVYIEVPTAIVSEGRDEIRAFVTNNYTAFPSIQVIPHAGFQAEEWAVLEADFAGTSAQGASFSVPFAAVFELEGDKIVRETDYFDLNALMTQLDASGAAATPAA
jgi:limonene-1,2-epoxide hydrolase